MSPGRLARVRRRVARSIRRLASAARRVLPRRSTGELDYLPSWLPAARVVITGWAYDRSLATRAVVITLDGEPVAVARTGVPRPPVEQTRRTDIAGDVGFAADVDLGAYKDSVVTVGALVIRDRGIVDELDPRTTRVDPALLAVLAPAGEAIAVRGVLRGESPAAWVDVHVDGHPMLRARTWIATPTNRPEPHAVADGFEAIVPLPARPPETPDETPRIVEAFVQEMSGAQQHLGPLSVDPSPAPATIPADAASLREQTSALGKPSARSERRVLVFTHSLQLGGGQLYLGQLLSGLFPSAGVGCIVISPTDGPLRAPLEERGITVVTCGRFQTELMRYEAQVLELAEIAHRHGADIGLVNTLSAAIGADVCRRLGIPYHWAIHESVPPLLFWSEAYRSGYDPEVRRCGLAALDSASALIFEADATLDLYRAGDRRLRKIPYGIDFTELDEFRLGSSRERIRHERGLADHEVAFVCVATMEPRKLQTGLVLAFERVAHSFPDARLVLVGDGPGEYSDAVHELVRRLDLADRVRIVGITPDVFDWYTAADVVVSTSDLESMPRSLMEAMAFERVVLSTDVFGVRELIDDGTTGFLMGARDLHAIIAGFERVLALTPEERHAMGRAASAAVRREHDASGYIAEYRNLLLGTDG